MKTDGIFSPVLWCSQQQQQHYTYTNTINCLFFPARIVCLFCAEPYSRYIIIYKASGTCLNNEAAATLQPPKLGMYILLICAYRFKFIPIDRIELSHQSFVLLEYLEQTNELFTFIILHLGICYTGWSGFRGFIHFRIGGEPILNSRWNTECF